jgi:hypothetical protein
MLCLSAYATPPPYMVEVSEEELDLSLLVARENGKQMANLNAGYHCDPLELSLLHPVWKETNWDKVETRPSPLPGENRITFSEKILSQPNDGGERVEEDTDFVERGERALCKVVKIVEATIESSGKITPILLGVKDKARLQEMNIILKDVISTLEAGKAYRFANSSSIRLKPNIHALNLLSKAYTVFQYFAGFPPEKLSPHILSNAAEVARNQPSGIPEVQK